MLLAAAVFLLDRNGALAYQVQPGDTLWAIYRRTGISIADLAARTRRSFLEHHCAEGTLCCTAHFPSPSRFRLSRWDNGFRCEPA